MFLINILSWSEVLIFLITRCDLSFYKVLIYDMITDNEFMSGDVNILTTNYNFRFRVTYMIFANGY